MKICPLSSDARYTVTREWVGQESPRYVVRFCGEWVAACASYSSAVLRAVGESARRRGALVIEEVRV